MNRWQYVEVLAARLHRTRLKYLSPHHRASRFPLFSFDAQTDEAISWGAEMSTGQPSPSHAIRAAIFRKDGWENALQAFTHATGSSSSVLLLSQGLRDTITIEKSHNISEHWQERYRKDYRRFDPTPEVFSRTPVHQTLVNHALLGHDRSRIPNGAERTFYNECLVPQDFYHTIGSVVLRRPDLEALIILQRAKALGEYPQESVQTHKTLTRELAVALHVQQELSAANLALDLAAELHGLVTRSIVLFDQYERAVLVNEAAEQLIRRANEIDLCHGSVVVRRNPSAQKKLRKLVANAVSEEPARGSANLGCARIPTSSGAHLHCVVAPVLFPEDMTGSFLLRTCRAVMFLSELQDQSPRALEVRLRAIADERNLTAAEADIVHELCCGYNLGEASLRLRKADGSFKAVGTLRKQLASVSRKLDVSSQSEVVAFVWRYPMPLEKLASKAGGGRCRNQ